MLTAAYPNMARPVLFNIQIGSLILCWATEKMSTFSKTEFSTIENDLNNTATWLDKKGIKTKGSRLEDIARIVKEIVQSNKEGKTDELVKKHTNVVLWHALIEASSFIQIYKSLKNQKSHLLQRNKLKLMLQGPFHNWDEDPSKNNTHGRNAIFELETAAKFSIPGIKVKGFDDVDIKFQGTDINIQCKRLYSNKQIEANIDKAVLQIQKKIKSNTKKRGLIALSIDKIAGKEEKILKKNSPDEISNALSLENDSFISTYNSFWKKIMDTRILGVIIFIHAMCVIKDGDSELLTTGRQNTFDILPQKTSLEFTDYKLATDLAKKMQFYPN